MTTSPTLLWVDHDGGVDDFMAMLIATKVPKGKLVGVTVIDGDCFVEPAVECSARVLAKMGYEDVVVAGCSFEAVNPFPKSWRGHAFSCNDLPCITGSNNMKAAAKLISKKKGEEVFAEYLEKTADPVTVIATGPLSTIAYIVKEHPGLVGKIKEIVVMGGAVDVKGNVTEKGHDGSAEWNLYWDPPSAEVVFKSTIPIVLFPLDATNSVPITHEFVQRFGDQNDVFESQFAGSSWAMCTAQAHIFTDTYYAWDALTAAYLVDSSICVMEDRYIKIDVSAASQGRTVPTTKDDPDAKLCKMCKSVDPDQFYDMMLRILG